MSSIKLPRWIKIGPFRFAVHRFNQVKRDDQIWGSINYWRSLIKIKGGSSVQNQAVALMHELVHGLLWTNKKHELNEDEEFIEWLSTALLDTLWHTPGLLQYLKNTSPK